MGQTTGRLTLGLGLLTTLAACSTPTDAISDGPSGKRGGVYLGASGYAVAQPDSTTQEVAADSANRGVYLGASGY